MLVVVAARHVMSLQFALFRNMRCCDDFAANSETQSFVGIPRESIGLQIYELNIKRVK